MFEMKHIWILGGGKFGKKAGIQLKQKFPGHHIVGVEKNKTKCKSLSHIFDELFCIDSIKFLNQYFKDSNEPEWIVPAIPVHLAFQWVKQKLSTEVKVMRMELPDFFLRALPNCMKGTNGDIYSSMANFICPDNCPEPEEFCSYTRKPRPYNLYEKIEKESPQAFFPVVIRSVQLAPGLGGISPKTLFDGLEQIKKTSKPVILATACRCHGVVSAFRCVGNPKK